MKDDVVAGRGWKQAWHEDDDDDTVNKRLERTEGKKWEMGSTTRCYRSKRSGSGGVWLKHL